jgi:L-ribulose-5-phosphate 4-epimerase
MLEALKKSVCAANRELAELGLAPLTWGNVSGIDRSLGLVVIKPSGVPYEELTPAKMAVVDLAGNRRADHNPSTDVKTHLALYRAWPEIAGVAHTHSEYAVMFAQACRPIPCLGSTHADHFLGEVPVTRSLTAAEVAADYETNTGLAIVERFRELSPQATPGVLVANHGPFTWGRDAQDALQNSLVLEKVAKMALGTWLLNPEMAAAPPHLQQKHYARKHGPDAYYGQGREGKREKGKGKR